MASKDPHHPRQFPRRIAAWLGGILTAVLIAVIGGVATGWGSEIFGPGGPSRPLVTVKGDVMAEVSNCTGLIVLGKQPSELGSLPSGMDPRPWQAFAKRHGGISSVPGVNVVQVIVQGSDQKSVVLTDLTFDVDKAPAPAGTWVHDPCGGPVQVRRLEADLDQSPPKITYKAGQDGNGQQAPGRPIAFPYQVSESDPEVISIGARARDCDCRWTATLHWVADGEEGTTKITKDGGPFRVIGSAGLTDTRQ